MTIEGSSDHVWPFCLTVRTLLSTNKFTHLLHAVLLLIFTGLKGGKLLLRFSIQYPKPWHTETFYLQETKDVDTMLHKLPYGLTIRGVAKSSMLLMAHFTAIVWVYIQKTHKAWEAEVCWKEPELFRYYSAQNKNKSSVSGIMEYHGRAVLVHWICLLMAESSDMWVRTPTTTVVLMSLSETLYHNCFSLPRSKWVPLKAELVVVFD